MTRNRLLAVALAAACLLSGAAHAQQTAPTYLSSSGSPKEAQGVFDVFGGGSVSTAVTPTAASTLVAKSSAGSLYGVSVTPTVNGYVMIFNATSAPADGTVSPPRCVAAASNQTTTVSFRSGPPMALSTGITIVFSSTGCFTKTASTTAHIVADYQ